MHNNRMVNMSKIINSFLVLILAISVFTGCESIEFLLEQNEKYEEEDRLEALEAEKNNNDGFSVDKINEELAEELVDEEIADEEISLTDELIAADGLIINRELEYSNYLGVNGQAIIEELLVVRRDDEHRYGDVLNYNGNKFFCNVEDECYAVFVKKDKVLGLSFPIARTEIVELMGAPIMANEEFQYYGYMDHVIRVPARNNEVKHCILAKDMKGLVAFMTSFNEEATYDMISMINSDKFGIMSKLGPAERESNIDSLVMHYDYQGIYINFTGDEGQELASKVLHTTYGGFGIDIGSNKSVLDMYYIEPLIKSDYYLYQYEDTYFSVFFEDDIIVALQVMTQEEAMKISTSEDYLAWADIDLDKE